MPPSANRVRCIGDSSKLEQVDPAPQPRPLVVGPFGGGNRVRLN